MSMFLVVQRREVVDTPADPGDPTATPPVPPTPAVTHEEVENCYIERDAGTVARNLAEDLTPMTDYYQVQFNGPTFQATLHPVTLKTGPRTAAPAREVAEIEANGQDVGSAIVEV